MQSVNILYARALIYSYFTRINQYTQQYIKDIPVVCRVDGTSFLLITSSAACSDQAREPGIAARVINASGEGPTVEIVSLLCAILIRSRSANAATAIPTSFMFLPASPMPYMYIIVREEGEKDLGRVRSVTC